MAYFDKIPVALYDFTIKSDKEDVIGTVPDLTSRVKLKWTEETLDKMTDVYIIKEGDSPQTISHSYYGTPEYYWTLLYLNNKFDIMNDWPMTEIELVNFCKKKYEDDLPEFDPDNWIFVTTDGDSSNPAIRYGQTEIKVQQIQDNIDRVGLIEPGFFVTSKFWPVGTSVVSYTTETIIVDKGAIVPNAANTTIYFARPLQGMDGLHHWENSAGVTIDKNIIEENVNGIVQGGQVTIYGYNETAIPITNYEHENRLNENKRQILVIKPEYIIDFVKNYNKAFV
jgi:Base plate wedge protein 53